jgi:uncharacterized protein (TIRG00374 family)
MDTREQYATSTPSTPTKWLLRLIGPALLVLFLITSDVGELVAILRHAHLLPLLISLILAFPFLLIKSWRWQRILRELAITLPFGMATKLYTIGVYLGAITPGQSGDLVKAWYLHNHGHPFSASLVSVVIDRLFDLIIMAFLATFGVFALGHLLPGQGVQVGLVLAMAGGMVGMLAVLAGAGSRQWLMQRALPKVLPARMHPALERWHTQLATLAMHPRMVLPALVASLLSAFFTFLRLWLLFVAIDVHIPLVFVVGASALIAVLQVLPISFAGVGVRDAVLIALLTAPAYNYSIEQALSLSALFLLLTLEHIVLGLIVSLWFPLKWRPDKAHHKDTEIERTMELGQKMQKEDAKGIDHKGTERDTRQEFRAR